MIRAMERRSLLAIVIAVLLIPFSTAQADPVELRLPLRDGRISTASLTDTLRHTLHLSALRHLPVGEINVRGLSGSLLVSAMNSALGEGCWLSVDSDALILHFDPDKLPRNLDEMKASIRTFTTVAAPKASAAEAKRWGLLLPNNLDPSKPLVVLVHGLDSDSADWRSMTGLLDSAGFQSARFDYPADGPIADDVNRFTKDMRLLHDAFPSLPIDIVAYSMGSLISRGYVEGDNYAGGVARLIMIAPPNHGSTWATFEPIAKVDYQTHLALSDPAWHPTWMITSGLGEAGRDLQPGSEFLQELNARPRRDGVCYTIVEGNQSPLQRIEAKVLARAINQIPEQIASMPSIDPILGLIKIRLLSETDVMRDRPAASDGPVTIASASLPGVTDVVKVHADHANLCLAHGDEPPAAWGAVRDRLMQQ